MRATPKIVEKAEQDTRLKCKNNLVGALLATQRPVTKETSAQETQYVLTAPAACGKAVSMSVVGRELCGVRVSYECPKVSFEALCCTATDECSLCPEKRENARAR